jgi:hypothetical protein
MYEFMVEIDLPVPFTEEFLSLVPRQRAMINKLMNEGSVTSYALSLENGRLWIAMIADSAETINALIESFPIADFITYRTNKLAFHNSISFKLPNFSLN